MATLLRGKRRGEEVEIHQFCNDWFSLKDGSIVSPGSLRLSGEEKKRVVGGDSGILFNLYDLTSDGTFKKRKR
jgi:hypothetical protein